MLKRTQKVCENVGSTCLLKKEKYSLDQILLCWDIAHYFQWQEVFNVFTQLIKLLKIQHFMFLHGSIIYVGLVPSLGCNAKMCEHFVKVIAFIVIQDQSLILFFFNFIVQQFKINSLEAGFFSWTIKKLYEVFKAVLSQQLITFCQLTAANISIYHL